MKTYTMLLALACLLAQPSSADEWQDLAHYKYGEGTAADAAEKLLQKTPVAQHGAIEEALIALLTGADATQDGKACACRMLQQIGTAKCIPAVAGLLQDEVLSHYARLVLERLGDAKADEAMRTALGNAPDKAKIGLLGSLGRRRDVQSVAGVAALAGHSDAAVAAAAIGALGRMGGEEAAQRLLQLKPAEGLIPGYMVALLDCARTLTGAEAVPLYERVLAGTTLHRIAAMGGMLAADEKKAVALMLAAIKGDDAQICGGVLTLVGGERSEGLTRALVEALGTLNDDRKAALIAALGVRGDAAALAAIVGCLASANERVRSAAIAAASKLGDGGTAAILLGLEGGSTEAIAKMPHPTVNDALIKALDDGKLKLAAIKALVARNCYAAVAKLFDLVQDGDAEVRKATWSGLGALASEEDMVRLAKVVFALKEEGEQASALAAARGVCSRARDRAACFEVVAGYYDGATDKVKAAILDMAAVAGSPSALEAVKKAMKTGDKELHGQAVRALAAWSNENAAPELLGLAKGAADEVERILALRGYIRIAGADNVGLNPRQRTEMFTTAAEMATRADEKKLLIGGLRKAPNAKTIAMVSAYLDDPDLRSEAEQSAIDLVESLRKKGPAAEVKALASKLSASTNHGIAGKAKKFLAEMGGP